MNRLTPQQRYELSQFVRSVKTRQLRTNDVRYILVLLREAIYDEDFKEWGSAVAHNSRDRGWLFQNAISIWATHHFYEKLDRNEVPLTPLPSDIVQTIVSHLEGLSPCEIFRKYGHILPEGTTSGELIATINHLYSRPESYRTRRGGKTPPREAEAFYHLVSEGGIEPSDKRLLRHMILELEDRALSIPPRPLSEIVATIENSLAQLSIADESLLPEDKAYLQLHLLVAFHSQVIRICPRAFQDITGTALGIDQIVVFVSSMENVLTLDVGFFEPDSILGYQPAYIRHPYSIFRSERCYYPLVASDLSAVDCLAESDENARVSLYQYALKVARREGRYQIVATHGLPDHEWFPEPRR